MITRLAERRIVNTSAFIAGNCRAHVLAQRFRARAKGLLRVARYTAEWIASEYAVIRPQSGSSAMELASSQSGRRECFQLVRFCALIRTYGRVQRGGVVVAARDKLLGEGKARLSPDKSAMIGRRARKEGKLSYA